MSEQTEQPDNLSDEQRLEYTQSKRKQIIEFLMPNGAVPADKGDKMILLSALEGMDKVSLTKIRIKADERQTDATGQASAILAKLLTMVVPSKARNFDPDAILPTLGNDVPDITVLDGETSVGTQNGSYESFLKQNPNE